MNHSSPDQTKISRLRREQLVTLGDLQVFKEDLLLSLAKLIKDNISKPAKKWLKSYEVLSILKISKGTLFNMRLRKVLPFTKIGNTIYYDQDAVNNLLVGKGIPPLKDIQKHN